MNQVKAAAILRSQRVNRIYILSLTLKSRQSGIFHIFLTVGEEEFTMIFESILTSAVVEYGLIK